MLTADIYSKRSATDLQKIVEESTRIESTILGAIQQSNVNISAEISSLAKRLSKAADRDKQSIVLSWQAGNEEEIMQISDNISKAAEIQKQRAINQQILNSLYFVQIEERRSKIPAAHAKTFKWVYDNRMADPPPWTDFQTWLQSSDEQDGLYWITGKAGSGKSTLMRYLYDDARTKENLKAWAGSRNLVFASCFFWNPGNSMQKSQTGLLQSLLHELLSQCLDIAPRVSPWRSRGYALGSVTLPPWTDAELLVALHTLIKETGDSACICFFIDGLDEFDGDDNKREEIIDLLKVVSRYPNAKVCLSSRPWLIFKDAFGSGPKLLLEDLTRDDIESYIQDEFAEHPRFKELRKLDDARCTQLVAEIVCKANGVFLWVFLVVRSLLQGLRNEDGLSDLFRRLDLIPADLEEYFKQMMTTIDSFYLGQASELFQVALCAIDTLSLMTVSFLHEEHSQSVIKAIRDDPRAQIPIREHAVARRLNVLCKGLLEVYKSNNSSLFNSYHVDFLHRTVRDFLLTNQMQSMLKSYSTSTFDAASALCASFTKQVQCFENTPRGLQHGLDVEDLLLLLRSFFYYASTIESSTHKTPMALVNEMSDILAPFMEKEERLLSSIGLASANRNKFNLLKVYEIEPWESYDQWRASFLALAITFSLNIFAEQEIKLGRSIAEHKEGRPVLDYALGKDGFSISERVVEALLKNNAQPNEKYRQGTVWGRYLTSISLSAAPFPGSFRVTELLIQYGAEQKPQVDLKERAAAGKIYRYPVYISPSDVFRKIYSAEQAEHLEAMLFKSRKQSQKRSLVSKLGGLFGKDKPTSKT